MSTPPTSPSAAGSSAKPAVRPKEFHFPVEVAWLGERRVAVQVDGKQAVEIAPPPVFRGTDPSAWSPEDLFVAAAASCLAVTFTGAAGRAGLEYDGLSVSADGVCGTRGDGRFGFTRLLLTLRIEAEDAAEARRVAGQAEQSCLVAASLDLPVETVVEIVGAAS